MLKRKFMVCLLVLSAAAAWLAGCQHSQVTEQVAASDGEKGNENIVEEETESVENMHMENLGAEKVIAWEAREPEKVEIFAEDYESWNKLLRENQISEEFRKDLASFAYESGSAVLCEETGNGNYSPLSLYYALALAGCGAEGETASQILEGLGVDDREELAEQCHKLYQWHVYHAQKEQEQMEYYGMENYRSTVQLGNSLWLSDRLEINQGYRELAAKQFFASSYGVDFGDADTGKRMGAWIAKKTNGVLEPQLSPDSGTLLAILNTLYFYGGWVDLFSEERTEEDIFVREDGSEVMAPYMNRTDVMGMFKKGDGYTLSFLRTNNDCQMMFLLPDEGKTVGEFLEEPQRLESAMEVGEEWAQGKVIWKVPKFDFGSSYKLGTALKAMGMERMFGDQAEFSAISPDPLKVSDVIQETHIGVDEQGVEGAAYTMLAMAGSALLEEEETVEMSLDRPFLFGIRDSQNGVWLFMGVCRDPAEK